MRGSLYRVNPLDRGWSSYVFARWNSITEIAAFPQWPSVLYRLENVALLRARSYNPFGHVKETGQTEPVQSLNGDQKIGEHRKQWIGLYQGHT